MLTLSTTRVEAIGKTDARDATRCYTGDTVEQPLLDLTGARCCCMAPEFATRAGRVRKQSMAFPTTHAHEQ
eukprot:13722408-Alexandrium_andersonii.AAC.1